MLSKQTAGADPIFGAIEAHRRARADFLEATLAADEIDTSTKAIAAREAIAQLGMDVEQHLDETSEADSDAQAALLSIQPTSIVGVIALLRYASIVSGRNGQSWEARCFQHVADALRRIVVRRV